MNSDFQVWPSAPPTVSLLPGAIQIWRVRLDQPASLERCCRTLSPTEQARASRFHFDQDRQRFQMARGVLRILLGQYLGLAPEQVEFEYGPYGKPSVAGAELQFNLSHSQGLAVYAFSLDRPLGVDVEYLRPVPQLLRIAQRYFSPSEQTQLQALSEAEQIEGFFQYWTCKEAYLKAQGTGLADTMPDTGLIWGEQAGRIGAGDASTRGHDWSVRVLQPDEGAIAALVAPGQDWSLSCWTYPETD